MVRTVAAIFGVAFLAVGVLGIILNPTGGELLGIFAVNVAHNLVHVAFGVLGIAAAYAGWSRLYLQGVGVIYLLLCVLGFIPGLYVGEDMLLGLVHITWRTISFTWYSAELPLTLALPPSASVEAPLPSERFSHGAAP